MQTDRTVHVSVELLSGGSRRILFCLKLFPKHSHQLLVFWVNILMCISEKRIYQGSNQSETDHNRRKHLVTYSFYD